MNASTSRDRGRLRVAIGVALLHLLLAWALLVGLGVKMPAKVANALTVINLLPPPADTAAEKTTAPAASKPNLRARAAPVVAPPVKLPVPTPPILAAPKAGTGDERRAGLADIFGPATGSDGTGDGAGEGDGDGDGGRIPSRLIAGRLKSADYPRAARDAGIEGRVTVSFTVGTDGRVTACEVTRSSGDADLDDGTCRLILDRYRFEPSRDARGRPVPDGWEEDHEWTTHGHRLRE